MTRPGVLQEAQPEEKQVQPKTNPSRNVKVIVDIKQLKRMIKKFDVLFAANAQEGAEKFGE